MLNKKILNLLKSKKIALPLTIFLLLLFNSGAYAISLGNPVIVSDSRFQSLGGIATDGTNIYVADYGANKIWRLDASRVVTPLINVSKPISVAHDGGKLYVITENGGFTYTTAGANTTPSSFGTGVVKASDIIVDSTYIYIADISAKNVKRYNKSTGAYVDAIGGPVNTSATDAQSGKFYMPSGLALSGTKLLVSDYNNPSNIKYTLAAAGGTATCTSGVTGDINYRVTKPTKLANKYDSKIARQDSRYYYYNFCPNMTGTNTGTKPDNIVLCSQTELINGTCPDSGGYLGYKSTGVVPDSYEGKPKGLVQIFNGTIFDRSYVLKSFKDATNFVIANYTLTSLWADGTYIYTLDSQGMKIDIYDDISNTSFAKGTNDVNYTYIPFANDNLAKSAPAGYGRYHKAGRKTLPTSLQNSLVIYRDLVKKGTELVISDTAGKVIYFPIQ